MSNTEKTKVPVSFAAIDPYIETNIVAPTEKETSAGGHKMITWGDGNGYPDYLLDLYRNCGTLKSCVDGCVDYICGNGVIAQQATVNNKLETPDQLVKKLALSLVRFGGFAIQVIRDLGGNITELYALDLRYVRTDKERSVFFYSEEFAKKYVRSGKMLEYPAFMIGADHPSSVYFFSNDDTQVYPLPWYAAVVKSCETERSIDEFHLNEINNGFTSSYAVNFNNGVPTDEIKEQIERAFNEKFSGKSNAGRIVFSWNPNVASRTTFEQLKTEDFGDKYRSLASWCRQQIFTSFRANPNLFGIPTESLGFSQEEYDSAFRLFNRTRIQPAQQAIVSAFDAILGEGALSIVPFSMDTIADDSAPTE